ncbi:hypothetical protein ABIC65_001111 [Sphingomonas trueperi]|uniref:hypothetical protein n=1 Tax=Sphingomonas trueperi TaxID=53317 RepID=UPI003391FE20
MALNALTLSITQGVVGRPFFSAVNGLTTSRIQIGENATPGFSFANGVVFHPSLPAEWTVSLLEYEPGVGAGVRESRISGTAATNFALRAQAIAALSNGRSLVRWRVGSTRQSDGSRVYSLYVEDDLGATTPQTIGGGSPTPTPGPTPTPTPTPLAYTMIYDFDTLNGATGASGATVLLDTSSRKVQGAAGLRIQANGVNATNVGTNAFLTTTFDFSTANTVAICVDCGDFYSNDFLDMRWSTSLGHVLRSAASGAALNSPFTSNGLGKVWTSTTVDNYRRLVTYNATNYSTASNVVTMAVTGGLSVGMYVFGSIIPAGTTITAVNNPNITLSNNPNATGTSNVPLTFSLANDVRGQSIKALGTASKSITFGVTNAASSSYTPDVVIDAMAAIPDSFLPEVHFTFDDANLTQFDNRSIFAAYGIKMNFYVPQAVLTAGGSSKFTWANLATMKAEGHGILIDSEGNDYPITKYQLLSTAITTLNNDAQEIRNRLGSTGLGLEHLCYSYGNMGYVAAPVTYTCASDGAAESVLTITSTSTPAYSNLVPGMRAFVGGAIVGIVKELVDQKVVKLDRPLTAGSYSVTFSARVYSVTATCNGTTTVTLSSTANLFQGMHLLASAATGLQADTRILSVDSGTQITVDKTVPSTVTKLEFGYVDGQYWPTKVMKALYDAGYRTARLVGPKNGALFTGFGPSPYQMLQWGPLVGDDNSLTDTVITQLTQNAAEKRDTLLYGHNIKPEDIYNNVGGTYVPANGINPNAHWPKLLSAVKALIDGGQLRASRSMPEWWADVSTRLPPT